MTLETQLTNGYCNSFETYKKNSKELITAIIKNNVVENLHDAMQPLFHKLFEVSNDEKICNFKTSQHINEREMVDRENNTVHYNTYEYIYDIKAGYYFNDQGDIEEINLDNSILCIYIMVIHKDIKPMFTNCYDPLKGKHFIPEVQITHYEIEDISNNVTN